MTPSFRRVQALYAMNLIEYLSRRIPSTTLLLFRLQKVMQKPIELVAILNKQTILTGKMKILRRTVVVMAKKAITEEAAFFAWIADHP